MDSYKFEDKLPFEDLYQECHNCSRPGTEDQPMKPCAQCLSRAYCCRECQKKAWKSGHKGECDKELGERIRKTRETWNLCREVWLEHQQRHQSQPHSTV